MNSKKIQGIVLVLVVVLFAGYFIYSKLLKDTGDGFGEKYNQAISDTQAGLYDASIEDVSYVDLNISYENNATAGTSTTFERSFENAPPLIPHDTEGMFPIVADSNMCLTCHDKAIAEAMQADMPNLKAIPASHYFSIRTEADTGDTAKAETGDIVSNERFNCDQCHVVQTDAKPLVRNLFQAGFSSDAAKKGSNFREAYNQGVVEEKIKTYGAKVTSEAVQ